MPKFTDVEKKGLNKMKKKHKLIALAAGAIAVGAYSAVKGKGVFNKFRFADQHEAVKRYLDSHHPGASYSPIEPVSEGWSTIVTHGETRYMLYLTCSEEGVYVFDESVLS